MSNILIYVDKLDYISDYRKAGVSAFLFGLSDYCVGYNTYDLESIKGIEVSKDDLKWNYFLQATKQKPFEIASDFIQTFTDDEMHIWGYYVSLSTSSFEPFSSERQKMLLEIYQWLNG